MKLNTKAPLGLPDGSVRGLLALIITIGGLIIFALTDKLSVPELLAIIGPVITLYFGQYITKPGA